jgi:hypothetical protein
LRNALLEQDRYPLAPCPHDKACPFAASENQHDETLRAGKKRWCHFAFATEDAPGALHGLSRSAGLPKERAVLSFLLAVPSEPVRPSASEIRIISDAFPLPPDQFGRYSCSPQGLVLLTGRRIAIANTASGALVNAVLKNGEKDSKSGALLAELSP